MYTSKEERNVGEDIIGVGDTTTKQGSLISKVVVSQRLSDRCMEDEHVTGEEDGKDEKEASTNCFREVRRVVRTECWENKC